MNLGKRQIYPYGELIPELAGNWPWGAHWQLFLGNTRPKGANTTSAICILFCEEGLVLTKTEKGGWEFTGGRCEMFSEIDFEFPHLTIVREVDEEAGAKLIWFSEVGSKVIYNPVGESCINTESGLPFPSIGFQEYFIGWCEYPTKKPYGAEVVEAKVIPLNSLSGEYLTELHEPRELFLFLNYFYKLLASKLIVPPENCMSFFEKNRRYLSCIQKEFSYEK